MCVNHYKSSPIEYITKPSQGVSTWEGKQLLLHWNLLFFLPSLAMLKWETLQVHEKANAKSKVLVLVWFITRTTTEFEGTMPLETSAGFSTDIRGAVTSLYPYSSWIRKILSQRPSYMIWTRHLFKSLADPEKKDIFLKDHYRLWPARFVLLSPAILCTLFRLSCLKDTLKSNGMKLHKCCILGEKTEEEHQKQ